jgi:uncharacterized protein (UPF0335 family)
MSDAPTSDGAPRPNTPGVASDQLKSIVERVERLAEEKAGIAEDIREVYAEAKGNGYDPKIIRSVVRIRAQDKAKREEEIAKTEMYLHALGML